LDLLWYAFGDVAEVDVEKGWGEAASLGNSSINRKRIRSVIAPVDLVGSFGQKALNPANQTGVKVVLL
jgi:hypothetical protein